MVKRLVILILSFSLLLIGVTACSGMTSGKVFKSAYLNWPSILPSTARGRDLSKP